MAYPVDFSPYSQEHRLACAGGTHQNRNGSSAVPSACGASRTLRPEECVQGGATAQSFALRAQRQRIHPLPGQGGSSACAAGTAARTPAETKAQETPDWVNTCFRHAFHSPLGGFVHSLCSGDARNASPEMLRLLGIACGRITAAQQRDSANEGQNSSYLQMLARTLADRLDGVLPFTGPSILLTLSVMPAQVVYALAGMWPARLNSYLPVLVGIFEGLWIEGAPGTEECSMLDLELLRAAISKKPSFSSTGQGSFCKR